MKEKKPRGFNKAEEKAKKLLNNEKNLNSLLNSAIKKAINQKGKLKSVWEDFQTLFRLINSWLKKDYKTVPWKSILYATTAILYFLNPLDIIPDFIPITGLIDDISIIAYVIKSIKDDLDKFILWEKEKY
jgi:uncharacterized membrane protein YkvA (DUF1232 family)